MEQNSNQPTGIPIPLAIGEQPAADPVGAVPPQVETAGQPRKTRHDDHRQMLETVVAVLVSKTMKQAAYRLGIDRSTLYDRMDKFGIRDYLGEIPQAALDSLRGASLKAAMNLIEDLDSHRPKIRQDASKYILDKSLPEQPKVQVNVQNTTLSMHDFVAQMQQRREERQQEQTDSVTNGGVTG